MTFFISRVHQPHVHFSLSTFVHQWFHNKLTIHKHFPVDILLARYFRRENRSWPPCYLGTSCPGRDSYVWQSYNVCSFVDVREGHITGCDSWPFPCFFTRRLSNQGKRHIRLEFHFKHFCYLHCQMKSIQHLQMICILRSIIYTRCILFMPLLEHG